VSVYVDVPAWPFLCPSVVPVGCTVRSGWTCLAAVRAAAAATGEVVADRAAESGAEGTQDGSGGAQAVHQGTQPLRVAAAATSGSDRDTAPGIHATGDCDVYTELNRTARTFITTWRSQRPNSSIQHRISTNNTKTACES